MKKLMFIVAAALSMTVSATQYSRLSIITAAKQYGKWQALKAWIVAAGFEDEWAACNYLSDDYPAFSQITNAVVQSGIATSEEVSAILAASVDTAIPDATLKAKYNRDMESGSGRSAWHGKATSYIDEEAFERVYVYEDGYTYREHWTKPESELERRMRLAREKAKSLVDAAERSAAKKPPAVARIIVERAKREAMALTNGVEQVTVDVKSGKVVNPSEDGK